MNLKSLFFSWEQYKSILKEICSPDQICESILEIDMEDLLIRGYRTVLLDVDNTLLTYKQKEVSLDRINWIEKLRGIGFEIYLVSNNSSKRRIQRIADQLNLTGLYFSLKPFTSSIKEFADQHFIDLEASIFIGDQLFTDVIVGNWSKGYTILIEPIDKSTSIIKTVQREIELMILRQLGIHFDTKQP